MSILIDEVTVLTRNQNTYKHKNLKWYIAKPIPFNSIKNRIKSIKDAYRVIIGKSFAVHYKVDE